MDDPITNLGLWMLSECGNTALLTRFNWLRLSQIFPNFENNRGKFLPFEWLLFLLLLLLSLNFFFFAGKNQFHTNCMITAPKSLIILMWKSKIKRSSFSGTAVIWKGVKLNLWGPSTSWRADCSSFTSSTRSLAWRQKKIFFLMSILGADHLGIIIVNKRGVFILVTVNQ